MAAPFAKSEMLDELRTILLFEGDHLSLGRGPEFAEGFLGFAPADGSNYCLDDPQKVDLERFPIADSFSRGYDYAYAPSNPIQIDESEVQDLIVFMDGVPRVGGTSAGGETHPFMTPEGLCRRVADTVFARWKLEINKGDDFTIRELALLANMSEGAVRNALSNKDLKSVKQGTATRIKWEEAHRWLLGRQGFVPMPPRSGARQDAVRDLLRARTARDFSAAFAAAIAERGETVESFGTRLELSEEELRLWRDGGIAKVFRDVQRVAEALEIDPEMLLTTLIALSRAPPR